MTESDTISYLRYVSTKLGVIAREAEAGRYGTLTGDAEMSELVRGVGQTVRLLSEYLYQASERNDTR